MEVGVRLEGSGIELATALGDGGAEFVERSDVPIATQRGTKARTSATSRTVRPCASSQIAWVCHASVTFRAAR